MTSLFLLTAWINKATGQVKYPERPIQLIVPYSPGGATDLGARALANSLPKYLGQPIMVINKAGGSGGIGTQAVIAALPDGYTMLMDTIAAIVAYPALNPKVPYKYDSLTPIGLTQVTYNVLCGKGEAPWKTVQDVFNYIRKNPGKVKCATVGPGSVAHLGMIQCMNAAGISLKNIIFIPFKSDGEMLTACLGGHIDLFCSNLTGIQSHIKARTIRAFAITAEERLKDFSEIPTSKEAGIPAYNIVGWRGVSGPPNLPDTIVKVWDKALISLQKDEEYLKGLNTMGDVPKHLHPNEYREFQRNQYDEFRKYFLESGIEIK